MIIKSSLGSYPIDFQSFDLKRYQSSFFLIDKKLQHTFYFGDERCVSIPVVESNKTLSLVEDVTMQLSSKGMSKRDELIVIGGGFLQDIGTLVASLYMRGIEWRFLPTTLAAMGDSCVGGKSSINAGEVKNLIGNFYPPQSILIDTSFVSTLPSIEIVAGMSEIIKICFAHSFKSFIECRELLQAWRKNPNETSISRIIQISLKCKKYFIEEDEFDKGIRKLLNFGHSFGHALEAASNFKIPHGVAVLLGMIAATIHPLSKSSDETKLLINTCLSFAKSIGEDIRSEISNLDFTDFSQALAKDKKSSSTNLVLVLPQNSGLELIEIPFHENALETATYAMQQSIELVLNEVR